MQTNNVLIYAQITREGKIHNVFYELVTKARKIKENYKDLEINAFIIGEDDICNNLRDDFKNYGIENVYIIKSPDLRHYSSTNYSLVALDLIKTINPSIILIGATNEGRDLAPRIACSLHTGLTADCIELDINPEGKLLATRPTFGGQLMATIMCKTLPQMATVRPNVFKNEQVAVPSTPNYIDFPINADLSKTNLEIIEYTPKPQCKYGNFDDAKIIVAGGKGLKTREGFEKLGKFAESIGACLGATRGAVEKGIAPQEIQIGQTGKTVHPQIYIACGISGAIQHTVGMENSDYIIAINNDETAPIFETADLGIVGDIFEILPELELLLKSNK